MSGRGATPLQLNFRVVALRLGQEGDPDDEAERAAEVGEGEHTPQSAVVLALPRRARVAVAPPPPPR